MEVHNEFRIHNKFRILRTGNIGSQDAQTSCMYGTFLLEDLAQTETKEWQIYFIYQLNAHFLYSLTICMLHYNPRHVSRINMPIFRRTNCIITASGIVTLYSRLERVTIPDAVIIQFVLLKMDMLMLETCRGL